MVRTGRGDGASDRHRQGSARAWTGKRSGRRTASGTMNCLVVSVSRLSVDLKLDALKDAIDGVAACPIAFPSVCSWSVTATRPTSSGSGRPP